MSREQKIELLIKLISQLSEKEQEDVIALIAYNVQSRERRPVPHPTKD